MRGMRERTAQRRQRRQLMPIAADHYRFTDGVDIHTTTHSYAILEPLSGKLLAQPTFPSTTVGPAHMTAWIGNTDGLLAKNSPPSLTDSQSARRSERAKAPGQLTPSQEFNNRDPTQGNNITG